MRTDRIKSMYLALFIFIKGYLLTLPFGQCSLARRQLGERSNLFVTEPKTDKLTDNISVFFDKLCEAGYRFDAARFEK